MAEPNKDQLREFLQWTTALQRAMESSIQLAAPENVWKYGAYKDFARKYNQLIQAVRPHITLPPVLDFYDLDKMRDLHNTVAPQQKQIFDGVFANVSILRAVLEGKIGIVEDKTAALTVFFQARLRSAIFRTPELERDVQDAVEQLLIGRGMQKGQDYDREVGRVKVSAKEVIPDFIVPPLSLAIEVKLIKGLARVREVVDEINADIAAYSRGYRQILFLVYDLGFIRDEIEFRHDLEEMGNVDVLVIKQ
jgi:REase_DpnII-MboI